MPGILQVQRINIIMMMAVGFELWMPSTARGQAPGVPVFVTQCPKGWNRVPLLHMVGACQLSYATSGNVVGGGGE